MPRTKLGDMYSKPKAPPLDDAWGRVLVRQKMLGMDLKTLAEKAGYHYDTVRHVFQKSPINWPPEMRDAILGALQLKAELVIRDAEDT